MKLLKKENLGHAFIFTGMIVNLVVIVLILYFYVF